jgi:DNA-binding response OmpR family regulator
VTARALRVLVVDLDEPILDAVSALLRRRGHDVLTATSAEEALAKGTPDVLVSDLFLGPSGGLELLEALHVRGARPHTVFVTNRPSLEDCRRALHLGAGAFLTKPFRLEELVRAVETGRGGPSGTTGFARSYLSTPACVELAAREIAAYALRCGLTPAARARVATAVAELVDNARRHAYVHARGRVRLEAQLDERSLVVRVADDGLGCDPETLQRARTARPRASGLARAMALAEDLHVDSAPGDGTCVTARFASTRVDFEEEGCVDLTEHDFLTPDLARRVLHAVEKPDTAGLFHLPPPLAVVVGRLLAGVALGLPGGARS